MQSRQAIDAVKSLLNRSMRIRTSDGRIFIGTFVCVDKQLNVVLTNTDEYRVTPRADANDNGTTEKVDERGRYVTMVMVPWRLVVKIEARNLDTMKGLRGDLVDSRYSMGSEMTYT